MRVEHLNPAITPWIEVVNVMYHIIEMSLQYNQGGGAIKFNELRHDFQFCEKCGQLTQLLPPEI